MYPKLKEAVLKERVLRVAAEAGGKDNLAFLHEVALRESEQSELRDRAIRSLSESGVSTAELAKLYDGIGESTLRDRLIRLFAERGDKAGIDKLIEIAKNDSNSDLRRRAIRKLGETGDARAKQFLEDRVK